MPNKTISLPAPLLTALKEASRTTGIPESNLIADALTATLPGLSKRPTAHAQPHYAPLERLAILALEDLAGLDFEKPEDAPAVLTTLIAQKAGIAPKTCDRLLRRLALRRLVLQCPEEWDGTKTRTWATWRPLPRVMVWIDRNTGLRAREVEQLLWLPDGRPRSFNSMVTELHVKGLRHVTVNEAEFA